MDILLTHDLIAKRFLQELAAYKNTTGLSCEALGRYTDTPGRTVRRWLNGESVPRRTAIKKVTTCLGFNLDRVFGYTEAKPKKYYNHTAWPVLDKMLKKYSYLLQQDHLIKADNVLGQIALSIFYYFHSFDIPIRLCIYGGADVPRHTLRIDMGYIFPGGKNYMIKICGNGSQAWVSCELLGGHVPRESWNVPVSGEDTRIEYEGPLSLTFIKFAIETFRDNKQLCLDNMIKIHREQEEFARRADNSESEI